MDGLELIDRRQTGKVLVEPFRAKHHCRKFPWVQTAAELAQRLKVDTFQLGTVKVEV